MRDALKGSWILQEYEDSIDAGLTPKLLEYMLDKPNGIFYSVDPWTDSLHPDNIVEMGYKTDKTLDLRAVFKFAESKMEFYSLPDSASGAISKLIATAEFIIDTPDAILKFHFDTSQRAVNFVKYDVGTCPHMTAYSHLINSKYLAGKYYRNDDEGKKHHIILTRCGSIEGAENIDVSMKEYALYSPVYFGFKTNPDVVIFYDKQYIKADMLSWEVDQDSLILSHEGGIDTKRIVLVKAL